MQTLMPIALEDIDVTLSSSRGQAIVSRDALNLPTPWEPPSGALEEQIAGAFAEVFKLDRVGANDDFFDLGGDSLLGEVLSGLISEHSGRDFRISALIEHGSPREIAGLLCGGSIRPDTEQLPRPPLFIVHGRKGFFLPKPGFRQSFAEGQELHVFELPGIRGGESYDRVEAIAAVYVAQLHKRYPEGPIHLASFCVGGLIALEMAAQLAARGRPVSELVLLDPALPKKRPRKVRKEVRARTILAKGGADWLFEAKLAAKFLRHSVRKLALRRASKANDVEDLERLRAKLLWKETRGRSKLPEQPESIEARAKLHLALTRYRPQAYDGPVILICSRERTLTPFWSQLFPRSRVRVAFETHNEVSGPASARMLQSILDDATASLPPLARPAAGAALGARQHA